MSKTLSVDERNIKEFLSNGEKNNFLIPDYQRTYEWGDKEIDQLFSDLTKFTEGFIVNNGNDTYFLGTIVSYVNDKDEREIIDGQQRIVSLHLLLRAIYNQLSAQKRRSNDVEDRLKEIRTAVWRRIKKTSSEVDYSQNYIRSESIDDNYKEVLQSILTTGKAPSGKNSYSTNYRRLKSKYKKLYEDNREMAEAFAYCLLNETIVFSIEANSRDAALAIFSTLNNRGKPLSAVNIFRAEIYKNTAPRDRDEFKTAWSKFLERAEKGIGVSAEDIFSQYMYYVRAQNNDFKGTTIGVRAYLTQNNAERLKDKFILRTLDRILNVWEITIKHKATDAEPWSKDIETLKIFDLLQKFPNHAWRSAAVIYYLRHSHEPGFGENFRAFMRKLFSQYLPMYMLYPDRTFVREDILKLNIDILKSSRPRIKFSRAQDKKRLRYEMVFTENYQRLLLKAAAYAHREQTELLPDSFTVERIANVDEDQLGNLTLLETNLSKKASQLSFPRKKEIYIDSSIAMTRELIDEPDIWTMNTIANRSDKIANTLIELWQKWSDDYDQ